jgi:hypothetical protein
LKIDEVEKDCLRATGRLQIGIQQESKETESGENEFQSGFGQMFICRLLQSIPVSLEIGES